MASRSMFINVGELERKLVQVIPKYTVTDQELEYKIN